MLIIENDKKLRESLSKLFLAQSFTLDMATGAKDGLPLARAHEYDVILVNCALSDMNGSALCRAIRASHRHAPILLLSSRSSMHERNELLDAGVDDYLGIPFSINELLFRVYALSRRPRVLMSPLLKVADLVLDPLEQRARRGSREIHLTRKEFALAEYLLRHGGAVVSRATLLAHIWQERDEHSNTIEAHIFSLRKKIDKGAKTKLIKTISGRGYKIEIPGKTIFN